MFLSRTVFFSGKIRQR